MIVVREREREREREMMNDKFEDTVLLMAHLKNNTFLAPVWRFGSVS